MANQKQDLKALLESLSIGGTEKAVLSRALASTSDDQLLEKLQSVSALSLREYVDWILARRRFSSLSELDGYRILGLFLNVREQAPTTEQLVEEFAIPPGRATSLLGRIRYGEGRALRRLAYGGTLGDIEARIAGMQADDDGMKPLLVSKEALNSLEDVAWAIIQDRAQTAKGGKYEGAEYPTFQQSGKHAGIISASERMWDLMIQYLKDVINASGS